MIQETIYKPLISSTLMISMHFPSSGNTGIIDNENVPVYPEQSIIEGTFHQDQSQRSGYSFMSSDPDYIQFLQYMKNMNVLHEVVGKLSGSVEEDALFDGIGEIDIMELLRV